MTPEQQQQWMTQWRQAAQALAHIQHDELAQMTDADALTAMQRVLTPIGVPYRDPKRQAYSGLIEQQRLFGRSRQR